MRCMVCEDLSFKHICKPCQREFLSPSLFKRKLLGKIPVYSFYKYQEIESLLLTKHTDLGYYIYTILAENSFRPFAQNFEFDNKVCSLSIDDHVKSGYSHTAILNKELNSNRIKPRYAKLRALSSTSYSGKDYQFRLLNPRLFKMKNFEEEDVILVDDIITTGLTLTQAVQTVQAEGKNVLFCLTLADARK
ncbi:MAG: phosphoribosyltransferase [Arcobacter sp.]|nr:MAG: phosphoribosyltransferase [Arcobacter sp.]